jgi:hypothetical protein
VRCADDAGLDEFAVGGLDLHAARVRSAKAARRIAGFMGEG